MDYKLFFTTDNKSGWKTKESTLKKNNPNVYTLVKNFIKENNLGELSFKQQIWHFINDCKVKKVCLGCGGNVEFKDTINKGYRDFCSLPCANKSGLLNDRAVASMQENHGVPYYGQHKDHKIKVKKTKQLKYGDENYNNLEKAKITKIELYGNPNYQNTEKKKITLRNKFLSIMTGKTSDSLVSYEIGEKDITLNCESCKNNYFISNNLFNSRLLAMVKLCTLCNPVDSMDSYKERELFEFISELLPLEDIIQKDRIQIKPLELDIYIPKFKFGIEFNGLYWHSNKCRDNDYHSNKTKKCEQKGIQLLHVFEDEWMYKKEIVKNIIKSKLGLNENKIFARKCIIKEVSINDTRVFLNVNHIQGYVNSKIRIGLYLDDKLVSLATFGGLRKALGSNETEGSFELLRYVNLMDSSVVGGFSRLMTHFIKTYQPKLILTYSDKRYFTGDVYKKFGFEYVSTTKPNYFYIFGHKRENRFKYRKDRLIAEGFDKDKSESQIMEERGINRIYDSGCKKWVLKL